MRESNLRTKTIRQMTSIGKHNSDSRQRAITGKSSHAFIVFLACSVFAISCWAGEKPPSDREAPPKDVFALPIRSIVEVLKLGNTTSPTNQVRVQGVVQANA